MEAMIMIDDVQIMIDDMMVNAHLRPSLNNVLVILVLFFKNNC